MPTASGSLSPGGSLALAPREPRFLVSASIDFGSSVSIIGAVAAAAAAGTAAVAAAAAPVAEGRVPAGTPVFASSMMCWTASSGEACRAPGVSEASDIAAGDSSRRRAMSRSDAPTRFFR